MERSVSKMLDPLRRSIGNMLARGVVSAVSSALKMQGLQVKLLAGEVKDGLEHFEPYGYTSHPKAGAEAVTVFMDGDRSHGVVIVVADRRYRLKGLAAGEVALYDDQGQKIHLTRSGIVVDGAGKPITIQNTPSVTMDTPQVSMSGNLSVTGNIVAQGDISDHGNKSMAGMRGIYNSHTHNDPQGGAVAAPNQGM
jgi:phage baseplate assembly protein V